MTLMIQPIPSVMVCLSLVLPGSLAGCNNPDVTNREADLSFVDVTQQAGLGDFRHETGAFGEHWFPESMGSGGGFIDYDGDGWQDILVIGGGTWPQSGMDPVPPLWLFRNNGDGTFSLRTQETGLADVDAYGSGMTVADYDNDGDEDFYFTTLAENMLFRNDGGTFTEVGITAGVAGEPVWSSSAAFFDADRDGWLDLYVGNYVAWTPETDRFCSLDGVHKSYCTPEAYEGIPSRFYHNDGDGTFSDSSERAGIWPAPGKTLGVVALDFNHDSWPDLMIANDTEADQLYVNAGDGTFIERGAVSSVAYDEHGKARAGMGVDAGIVDSTGAVTVFVGNFSKEMIGVYRYLGNGLFTDRAAASRIGRPSLMTLTFGLFLADVDLDGDLDVFAANGHVQPDIEQTQEGIYHAEPPHLFMNDGGGRFEDRAMYVPAFTRALVARGAAFADYDRDGDVDILATENDGPMHLWRNEVQRRGPYLRVHTRGTTSNRDGVGTRIVAMIGTYRMERYVRAGSSYLSHSEKAVTFGLGAARQLDSLVLHWPSGQVDRFADVAGYQDIRVAEGSEVLERLARPDREDVTAEQ